MTSSIQVEALMAAYPRRPRQPDELLCVDFINTVDIHDDPPYCDDLSSYQDLVLWALNAKVVDRPLAEHLLEESARRPDEAEAAQQRAIKLRESLYGLISPRIREAGTSADDLAIFNTELAHAMSRARLTASDEGMNWDWSMSGDELDYPLWPVVRSATDVLTSDELDRIGECGSDTCQWLFLDTSKNRSRRYCGEGCSNRTRIRRHRERLRGKGTNRG
jgi:predicted RNA-binding Zn ribbon-like protein